LGYSLSVSFLLHLFLSPHLSLNLKANLPPVSTTLVANLPLVSTAPTTNFANSTAGVVDTGGKVATDVNGVNDTGGK
jgi:hypothetical protein